MRVIITTTQVPFVYGGAEIHAQELCKALELAGHEVEIVAIPFQTYPLERILDTMLVCRLLDLTSANGRNIDRLIGLKFPAYLIPHPRKVLWILHQHRQAYELWGNPYGGLDLSANGLQIRENIIRADNNVFAETHNIFSNSKNVARRLKTYNNVDSIPLYHPPQDADSFYFQEEEGYFFFPSRINQIKRQELVVEALAKTTHPVPVIFAGKAEGNFDIYLQEKIAKLGLTERARFIGRITNEQKIAYCAKSLAVLYPPFEEDYGYVTLEGMLASKPVITCQDSGGPLEFIRDRETGLIVEPTANALAAAMDELWENRSWAAKLGKSAGEYYKSLDITWSNVIKKLLA
ncbi:glycosyltransferase family 4 protein [Microcystis aeruginosa]|uniref:glycosyltransferase family 4 protein n=1 Tax=Microcystis aeruginosa TaxID=1126 RepID=UPI00232C36BE|nr:glycosyltransferase family 4 protein [Microcystis aeruginosa]MDB9390551.1 glycosyltransferase family 4 protein [Microcystis aeruginosa CS-579]